MRCDDERCTGNHNDRKPDDLCPRTQENKRAQGRRSYWRHREAELDSMAQYRTTAAFMLSQVRYELFGRRRGGGQRETTE